MKRFFIIDTIFKQKTIQKSLTCFMECLPQLFIVPNAIILI